MSNTIRHGARAADVLGKHFMTVHNAVFRDPRLKPQDMGIFGHIWSHEDGFGLTVEQISEGMDAGISLISASLKRLEQYGYLVRRRIRNADGTLAESVYEVTDMPEGLLIITEAPYDAEGNRRSQPTCENRILAGDQGMRSSGPTCDFPSLDDPGLENHASQKTKSREALSPLRGDSAAQAPARIADPADDVKPDQSDAQATAGQPPVVDVPAKPSRDRSFQLPADWVPDDGLRAWARDQGLTDPVIDTTVADFRRYWCEVQGTKRRTARGWDGTFRNWVRKDLADAARRRTRPGAAPLADPEAEAAVGRITGWWWAMWERKGPILDQSRDDLERLVRAAVSASLTLEPLPLAAQRVQEALRACARPVPFRDQFQRALLGEPVGPGAGRQTYTGDGWADGSSAASWAAWAGQSTAPDAPAAGPVPAPAAPGDDGPPHTPPPAPVADGDDSADGRKATFMAQWAAISGGGRDAA
ncbi:DnaT-like ssDNA-binding domain-containing protein [Planobispora siamensis]|uniref:DnaT DNA-binding domain-containing protein n=1 Tax=Planobispora siamensis TaxID=936338 RepID=A0A8J3WPV0_9ACTN|nr:DnaT-like ssDNA-binding domain-containing protein [Planobispora siamensis]GIH95251.1 hypothetical protein Psi01_58810 [Planobispora siamensis]